VLTIDTVDGRKTTVSENSFTREPSPMMREVMENGARLINRGAGPSKSVSAPEIGQAPACVPFGDKTRRSASMMYVPIRHGWKQVGILSIQSYKPNAYTEVDLERLQALANHCAGAMERIRALTEWKRLEREILHISAREQRRIGHDLHDSLCQHLTATALAGQVLAEKLQARSIPEASGANKIIELVENGIALARNLARGIYPVEVEAEGLMVAFEELARNISAVSKVTCIFECEPPVLIHDATMAMHLYRIAQEAVSNAIRHGKAKRIGINLTERSGTIVLAVEDDGLGLPENWDKRNGLGTRIMAHRATMMGGAISIEPNPTGGTLVKCSFPASAAGTKQLRSNEHPLGQK
jgi:signal transduction histidine kinase